MNLKRSDTKLLAVLLLAILVSYGYFHLANLRYQSITNFDECVTAGFPVLTKYPEECKMPGKIFVNERQQKTETQAVSHEDSLASDFTNITYVFEGRSILFSQGEATTSFEGATNKKVLTFQIVASSSILADLTGDLENDTVFLIRSFDEKGQMEYYLAAALKLYNGYTGSNILRVPASTSSPSLVYKNGGVVVRLGASEKVFNFENNLLVQKH